MTLIRLAGGRLCDPASGYSSGVSQDLYIQDGRIVALNAVDTATRLQATADQTIDCTGCVVMAGGIDLHTHIGGGKVTLARMLMPDSMPCDFLPSTRTAGDAYLRMGYTVAVEPAMLACNARQAHAEMADTPHLDTAAYVLLGNDRVLLELIASDSPQSLINDYVAFVVTATQAIGVKVVNAGGIDAFKFNVRKMDVDTVHPQYGVTPATVIRRLTRAVYEIGLPHPLHVHCSNLGVPGNIRSTLATIAAADGLPIHITHAQFHSYEGGDGKRFASGAAQLAEAVRQNSNVTIDVGQIMFGQTVTISGDTMHQYANIKLGRPRKSALVDIECEAGCGAVPFRYRNRQFVHSLQWAIGLELFLMIGDPARVFLTTDHPNGGPFTAYPHLIRLLMDRSFRETAISEIHPDASAASQLTGIDRQYSLDEIAIMTRSSPAKILGLHDQGTLAAGSVADIVVYQENENRETMFKTPLYVIRRGEVLDRTSLEDNTMNTSPAAKVTHTVRPLFDPKSVTQFAAMHAKHASFSFHNLVITDDELASHVGSRPVIHPCRTKV
ncbi:MAG TPA: formylmethanofuran dehydrogenase subunit A [Planctomycetaceae bacterium]|nr:formylmethanofuran dehydrogenase subunit A [Planctomycetaceae bacterium]